jgi:hypothetical protein
MKVIHKNLSVVTLINIEVVLTSLESIASSSF